MMEQEKSHQCQLQHILSGERIKRKVVLCNKFGKKDKNCTKLTTVSLQSLNVTQSHSTEKEKTTNSTSYLLHKLSEF